MEKVESHPSGKPVGYLYPIGKEVQPKKELKPSDFCKHPWACVFRHLEQEQMGINIMIILKRTGNVFRELTFEEYKTEREKDGGFSSSEKHYFEQVIPYCKSAETAALFSDSWKF